MRFSRNPETQAKRAVKVMHRDKTIAAIGTANAYKTGLKLYAAWLKEHGLRLENTTREHAISFLEVRAQEVGQSALNRDRQAIQAYHEHFKNNLVRLPVITSELAEALKSRAYSLRHIELICGCQTPANAFSTLLAQAAGLRAHELLTLRRAVEKAPDVRARSNMKFLGLRGYTYTVTGKGGLVREVKIPYELADRLEQFRLDEPRSRIDREIYYQQHYDVRGGHAWSQSFSAASQRALDWSNGAHGMRHSYAQNRMQTLTLRLEYSQALEIVSQELGHFRPEITLIYLR